MSGSVSAGGDAISANVGGVSVALDKQTATGIAGWLRSISKETWIAVLACVACIYVVERGFPYHIGLIIAPVKEEMRKMDAAVTSLSGAVAALGSIANEMREERQQNNQRMDRMIEHVLESRKPIAVNPLGGGS
jgi:ferritin